MDTIHIMAGLIFLGSLGDLYFVTYENLYFWKLHLQHFETLKFYIIEPLSIYNILTKTVILFIWRRACCL